MNISFYLRAINRTHLAIAVIITAVAIPLLLTSGDGDYQCDSDPITAQQGDTFYDLVHERCEGNLSNAVDDVVEAYKAHGTNIEVFETVYLPRTQDCYLFVDIYRNVFEDCE